MTQSKVSNLLHARFSYFDQHYLVNDYKLLDALHIGTTITFLVNGNWYCGLWAILQAWIHFANAQSHVQ